MSGATAADFLAGKSVDTIAALSHSCSISLFRRAIFTKSLQYRFLRKFTGTLRRVGVFELKVCRGLLPFERISSLLRSMGKLVYNQLHSNAHDSSRQLRFTLYYILSSCAAICCHKSAIDVASKQILFSCIGQRARQRRKKEIKDKRARQMPVMRCT